MAVNININKICSALSYLRFFIKLVFVSKNDIQIETRCAYQKADLNNNLLSMPLHLEFYIGLGNRYLPFNYNAVYRIPVRFTFALLEPPSILDFEIGEQVDFDLISYAGLSFYQKDNLSGILLGFQHRTLLSNAIEEYYLCTSWTISYSFMFGSENTKYYQS